MQKHFLAAIGAAALLPVVAAAQQPAPAGKSDPLPTVTTQTSDGRIILVPGRAATLKVADDAKVTIVSDAATAPPPPPPGEGPVRANWFPVDLAAVKVQPGVVGLSLHTAPGKGSILVSANGLQSGILYVVGLLFPQGNEFTLRLTTTCAVPPGLPGIERWPDNVAGAVVMEVMHVPGPVCADPASGELYEPGTTPPSRRPAGAAPAPGSAPPQGPPAPQPKR